MEFDDSFLFRQYNIFKSKFEFLGAVFGGEESEPYEFLLEPAQPMITYKRSGLRLPTVMVWLILMSHFYQWKFEVIPD